MEDAILVVAKEDAHAWLLLPSEAAPCGQSAIRDILLLRIRRMNGDGRDADGKFLFFGQDARELRDETSFLLVILSTMLILSESEV